MLNLETQDLKVKALISFGVVTVSFVHERQVEGVHVLLEGLKVKHDFNY